ncbi:uncharacterized protein LOC131673182 [Phymastichus coffea]|uniref:uncharacterized protein LOC131673182 n=1 Tax=Phymastichus coffea TaxID=108790 RepID=UPI00273B1AC0|nr:uncharacterized protein LOC131673182 [Phymastichus coffea]
MQSQSVGRSLARCSRAFVPSSVAISRPIGRAAEAPGRSCTCARRECHGGQAARHKARERGRRARGARVGGQPPPSARHARARAPVQLSRSLPRLAPAAEMSSFKRHQSKVFWGRMESRDVGGDDHPRAGLGLDATAEEREAELSTQEDSEQEADTTVIHVAEPSGDAAPRLLPGRSLSPATSRGQRSQDSGFSDSGRSDSSGTSGLRSPERRRRRRRSSRGSRSQRLADLAAASAAAAANDGPAHTSTPKQREDSAPSRAARDDLHAAKQLQFRSQTSNDEEEQLSSLNSNEIEEHLNDFLYASEPPEEDDSAPSQRSAESPPPSLALSAWLDELRAGPEDECTATLQSKSLPKRRPGQRETAGDRDQRPLTASATTAAKKLIDAADAVERRYQQALRCIGDRAECGEPLRVFETEAADLLRRLGAAPPRRVHPRQEEPRDAALRLARLKDGLDRALEHQLDLRVRKVVAALDGASHEDGCTARGALAGLTALGLAGPRAGASVARCGGVRALLARLAAAPRSCAELRCGALRALASVCCCLEAVDQLVRDGGPEVLADALSAARAPLSERTEAAALLVQLTAPWMDRVGLPYVEPYGPRLVAALTELAERCTCRQSLLLAAAALNHLAPSRRCIAAIVDCQSIRRLLRCVKRSSGGNVCLMEQVASLVGQVARVPQARAHLAETRASVALVCFLRMQPPGLEDEYRRLAATTSEALTRLCVDPEIAKQVVAVGGSDFLPEHEEDSEQRFQSTKSLRVARKIAAEQIDIARIWDYSSN